MFVDLDNISRSDDESDTLRFVLCCMQRRVSWASDLASSVGRSLGGRDVQNVLGLLTTWQYCELKAAIGSYFKYRSLLGLCRGVCHVILSADPKDLSETLDIKSIKSSRLA